MKTKTKTIDEVCRQPNGSFNKFIKRKNELLRIIEKNRKDRIYAIRNNQPIPELGFEVELWMVV